MGTEKHGGGATDPRMLGAHVVPGGVEFRVWAPGKTVAVVVEGHGEQALKRGRDGVHRTTVAGIGAGARYRFRIDGGGPWPDPWARFMPDGPHGAGEVIDPAAFVWTDEAWPGFARDGLVIYELHVGAYTPAGTFAALIAQLPALAALGVNAIELLPVATCPGRWNWGYDGVGLFAPSPNYGRPDDLRALVDAAHAHGIGVLLDVVYNHLGPDGNYLGLYSERYTTKRRTTPWGPALNYDGRGSTWVRNLVVANMEMWVREYHIDGFRLDATHAVVDESERHVLAEGADAARAAAGGRGIVVTSEDGRNDVRVFAADAAGGFGVDADWSDDFHHVMRVVLTAQHERWYASYTGAPDEIARTITGGYLYQGQYAAGRRKAKGTPVTDEPAAAFVFFLQNHDQVGNWAFGDRLHHLVEPGRWAAATAIWLFAPETPLIFMGQEFASSAPFRFFTDFDPHLGGLVRDGRRSEFAGFAAYADPAQRARIPDPQDEETFLASKLDLGERERHAAVYALHRDLLALRREDPVCREQRRDRTEAMAVGGQQVAVRRWSEAGERLLVANFGAACVVAAEALPVTVGPEWRLLLTTTDARYGGNGDAPDIGDEGVAMPARCAAVWARE
jgi:maltooligosyltrehalose trehalohydrolase